MTRVKRGTIAKQRHKKILNQAKGYYGAKSRVFRVAKQAVIKAHQYAYRDRKCKKRTTRRNWILIINSALKKYNLSYNLFIKNLKINDIQINRKMLHSLIKNENINIFNSFVEKIII